MSSLALRQSDLLRVLQAGNIKYLILGINLLLVIWIASQLATLTWGMVSPDDTNVPVVSAPRSTPVKPDADRRLIGQLPGWHLMGMATQNTATATVDIPADAPDTRLQLTLRGVLASDEPGGARAIIADPKGKDEQYSIGDALPGNAELSEIYPDRVILKRSGRYETLRLPVNSRQAGSLTRRSRSAPGQLQSMNGNPQARLAAVRQQLKQDSRQIDGLLRAAIHKDGTGKMIGYRISPGRDPALFAELGLADGDVVTQVNDMDLSDPANSARALQALQSGASVSVTLVRDGQEQLVTLDGL
jgi:general secretion pathway protein C